MHAAAYVRRQVHENQNQRIGTGNPGLVVGQIGMHGFDADTLRNRQLRAFAQALGRLIHYADLMSARSQPHAVAALAIAGNQHPCAARQQVLQRHQRIGRGAVGVLL